VRSYQSRHRDNLIASTVQVNAFDDDGDQRASGTGFLAAPGKVVTCAHVVPAGNRYKVTYQGKPYDAEVLVREPQTGAEEVFAYPDVALLSIPLVTHPCIPLNNVMPEAERVLYAYGYPSAAELTLLDHVTLVVEGQQQPLGTNNVFLKTKSGQVRPGASGSGAVDVQTGELVGMVAQTRNAGVDLGGLLIPASTILDTLAACGHDIAEANRLATCAADTLAGSRRRLRWALQLLTNELAGGNPTHWRSMLMTLDEDPPEPLTVDDAAFELLNLDLNYLGKALTELARACRSADVSLRLLGGAAAFAWLGGRPLVEPYTATQLAAERRENPPRVVHIPAGRPRSIDLHTTRAAVDNRWEAVALTGLDAETDPVTGLPAQLVRKVRCQLLYAFGSSFDPDDPQDIDQVWAASGEQAKADVGGEFLFALPADTADVELVTALRREFAPCVFVLTGHAVSAALRRDPAMLMLHASLDEISEKEADKRYDEISTRIARAVR
jgi:hypothetical protein